MKTLRFALIAVIVACTMVSLANTDEFKSKPRKAVNITYDKAVKIPGLVIAIKEQVDPGFLNKIEQLYVVEATYDNSLYRVLGSRQNWIRFYKGPIPQTWRKARAIGGGEIED